jgi:hypothetical protein
MAKKTSWAVIIVGISAFVLIVGVALVAVVGYVIYQQFAFQAKSATEMSADDEFAQIVAKFEGQKPYLVIKDGQPVISNEPAAAPGRPVEALHIIGGAPGSSSITGKPAGSVSSSGRSSPRRLSSGVPFKPIKSSLIPADLAVRRLARGLH